VLAAKAEAMLLAHDPGAALLLTRALVARDALHPQGLLLHLAALAYLVRAPRLALAGLLHGPGGARARRRGECARHPSGPHLRERQLLCTDARRLRTEQ
jgi:hypothetical protein